VKHHRLRITVSVAALASCMVAGAPSAQAQAWRDRPDDQGEAIPNTTPPELQGVDIVEHLGGALPRDATFRDSDGKTVKLGDYFDGKRPTLFVFAYHTCPMLCSLVLDATVKALNDVSWTVGQEFDVVSVSIDPKDTPESATKKRAQVVQSYPRARGSTAGWHFLTGDEPEIRKVTDAVGFQYRYDARQKQYAHPAAIYLLTPDGRIARYLYGIQFEPGDVRLGLLEATEGRSISTTEKLILYCYHYDPQGKRYSLVAMRVMRIGGGLTALVMGGLLAMMWAREYRRKKKSSQTIESSNVTSQPQAVNATGTPALLGETPARSRSEA
jgi:protein SCO1/2